MKKEDFSENTLPNAGCLGQTELPTPKEREFLDKMRVIKDSVRQTKKDLLLLKSSVGEKDVKKIEELEKILKGLKADWAQCEKSWKEAVRERMIALGHEEG